MSSEPSWNGVPLRREPGPGVSLPSNVEFVPENCAHYYDENGNLMVITWPNTVAPPPPANQAPGAHPNYPKNPNLPPDAPPDWIKVGAPPDPFTPGWTADPATNPNAQWVVGIDSGGNYIYGTPPASTGSIQAQVAAIAVAVVELSKALAGKPQPK